MGLFPPGKGGGDDVAYGFKGKGVTNHLLTDGNGMPIALSSTAANQSEQGEVEGLLGKARIPLPDGGRPKSCPKELQADKGYDSKKMRTRIRRKGVRPIIPRREYKNRKRPGRKPPKLVDRFKVERAFSWMQRKFRRTCIRWERRRPYWLGFLTIAMTWMWIERLLKLDPLFG